MDYRWLQQWPFNLKSSTPTFPITSAPTLNPTGEEFDTAQVPTILQQLQDFLCKQEWSRATAADWVRHWQLAVTWFFVGTQAALSRETRLTGGAGPSTTTERQEALNMINPVLRRVSGRTKRGDVSRKRG